MVRRRDVLAGVAAGAGTFAGCLGTGPGDDGTDTADGDGTGATGGSDATVTMRNTAFHPVRLSADAGTTVRWTNEDGAPHTVVAAQLTGAGADWSFDTDRLGQGDQTTHTFDSPGVYEYYCDVHGRGTMCGVVLVGDASLDGSLPCESGGGGGGSGGDGDGNGDDGGYY